MEAFATTPVAVGRLDVSNSEAEHALLIECVGSADLEQIRSEWRELFDRATEPNINFSPEFAAYFVQDQQGQVIVIRENGPAKKGDLIGLFPLRKRISFLPSACEITSAFHSPYSANTVPLIKKGFERAVCEAFLDWANDAGGKFGTLIFEEFRLDGSVWRHMRAALDARGQAWCTSEEQFRPLADTSAAESYEGYLANLKGKTRQTLKRKARQLEKLGEVTFAVHSGDELKPAMREFLELESGGWKGAVGTAMAQHEFTRKLALDVLCGKDFPQIRLESLRLDGKPIAMTIHLGAGDSAVHFKPAYDEAFSRYSPGLLLHLKTIEGLYHDGWAVALDGATKPDSPLRSIWRESRHVGRLIIGASPNTPAWLPRAVRKTIATYQLARSTAGKMLRRVK